MHNQVVDFIQEERGAAGPAVAPEGWEEEQAQGQEQEQEGGELTADAQVPIRHSCLEPHGR